MKTAPLFPPHGQVDFTRQGQRLFGQAEGPFNVELATAHAQRVLHWCRTLHADGPYDHVCEFRLSLLATPDAMAVFWAMLKTLAQERVTPVRTAYVFGPELEGGSLLRPLYERSFQALDLELTIVETQVEALAWLDARPL